MRRMMMLVIAAGLAAGGMTAAMHAQDATRYQIVTTPQYEGAIIPAPSVPPMLKPSDAGTWTPTPADVASAERALTTFLAVIAKDRSKAANIVEVNEDITFGGLPDLIKTLSTHKRQYIGLTYGAARRMLVHGLPDDPEHRWQLRFNLALEASCRFWWYEFSVADRRVVAFNCQGVN